MSLVSFYAVFITVDHAFDDIHFSFDDTFRRRYCAKSVEVAFEAWRQQHQRHTGHPLAQTSIGPASGSPGRKGTVFALLRFNRSVHTHAFFWRRNVMQGDP